MFCKAPFRSPADVSARQQSLKERRQNYWKRLNTRWTIRSFWWTICIIRNKTPCYITLFTWQTGATGVFVCWTGRPDRSPLHFEKCFVDGEERLCHFVKTSNESPENARGCTKIRIGDRERNFRAVCVFQVDGIFVGFLSFCILFLCLCSLPSVFSHGRTQNYTSEIVPLRSLKNGDRWVFSYGRVGTTVRTRRYDGSRSSVRSQS